MESPTQWTWVWVHYRSWTGGPDVLWFMGSQGVRHNWVTELNWTEDSDAIQTSHHLPPSSPLAFYLSQHQSLGQLFISDGQCIGASASAWVLSMNIQGRFPLGLTGLISLQSKGPSKGPLALDLLHQFLSWMQLAFPWHLNHKGASKGLLEFCGSEHSLYTKLLIPPPNSEEKPVPF